MVKVLIVDDIESNRKMLRKMLLLIIDCSVLEAVNGSEAVDVVETESPDLILMDINMPIMNGFQSASKIKSMLGECHVPIIFITALSSDVSLGCALASGGDDFISKPVNVEVLESKINAHLRIRELNQQLNKKNKLLSLHNQKLEYEHELIEHFFESALEKSYLDKDIIKYHMSSLSTFNGDVFLVARGPNGGMYVLMGDFTGHGLTAAMGTLPVAMVFFKMTSKSMAVSDMAYELNQKLYDLTPTSMFFSATLLEINARCDFMTVWMGGVPESYLFSNKGALKSVVKSQHMPLGILNPDEFDKRAEIFTIEKNDKLYLYSDGLIETEDVEGTLFGCDRLKDVLISEGGNRFLKVLEELNTFSGGADQHDDVTFIEVTCSEVAAIDADSSVCSNIEHSFAWQMSMQFTANDMREDESLNKLSEMLGSISVLGQHKDILQVLLSEIYSNALEHGILGLRSSIKKDDDSFSEYYNERKNRLEKLKDACIDFEFKYYVDGGARFLDMEITHSGEDHICDDLSHESDLYGRGMLIINGLCDNVKESEDGKSIRLLYCL